MKVLVLKSTDPYLNLAIEEYLFLNSNDDVFMLWQNKPSVILGKNQNVFVELNLEKIKEKNIKIVRRITGGGAVYHDLGNVNYSFISKKNGDQILDFKFFSAPIIEVLKEMGVNASLSGRNDLIVNGMKISGNAEKIKEGRILHHGTLLYNADLDVLSAVLNVDKEKLNTKAIKSVRSRVCNISDFISTKYDVQLFIDIISKYVTKKYNATPIEFDINDEVISIMKRNSSAEWIFPNSTIAAKYTITKKKRYDFGSIEIKMQMKNNIIEDIMIYGDFFEKKNINHLIENIRGKTVDEISSINAEQYIYGIKNTDFYELIKS